MTTFSLDAITTDSEVRPPRIVVYGVHGVGKTTFATSAPNPIVLRTEDGLATLRVPKFPIAKHYEDMLNAIGSLYSGAHDYQTAIVDTLDWLEPLVWRRTAFLHNKEDIEAFGYGKGYIFAADQWTELLQGLTALNEHRGMTIICLAHADIKRFDAPDTEPYDRYQIKLHKRAADLVQEWADVVGFMHYEVNTVQTDAGFNKKITRGVGHGIRVLGVEERPAYSAKNRYHLPPLLPLPKNMGWDVFAQACAPAFATDAPPPVEPAGADLLTTSTTD